MRNQLLHTVVVHTTGFVICRRYKIARYKVVPSAVYGKILLLPVSVCHVKNARTWLPALLYVLLWRQLSKILKLSTLRACFIAIHVCSGKIRFSDFIDHSKKTGSIYRVAQKASRYQIIKNHVRSY